MLLGSPMQGLQQEQQDWICPVSSGSVGGRGPCGRRENPKVVLLALEGPSPWGLPAPPVLSAAAGHRHRGVQNVRVCGRANTGCEVSNPKPLCSQELEMLAQWHLLL